MKKLFPIIAVFAMACLMNSSESSGKPRSSGQKNEASNTAVNVLDLKGLKGLLARNQSQKKRLMINFWATWCIPCREEFPDLVKLNDQLRDSDVQFVTISLDEVEDIKPKVIPFLNQTAATMPAYVLHVVDPDEAIQLIDPTWSGELPATFVFDQTGKTLYNHKGKLKDADFEELRTILKPS